MTTEWVVLCKRTEDPKLLWLEHRLADKGIKFRRRGYSFHAPILEVQQQDEEAAWEILRPVDDLPDDLPRWQQEADMAYIKFKSGSVVYHSKAIFGPGTVLSAAYDEELETVLYEVMWQSSGQVMQHTENSLSRVPVTPAGRL